MRIAQVSTLATAVGPGRAGSVESLVWLLARELTDRGHDVTVFAGLGSEASAEVVTTSAGPYYQPHALSDWQQAEWVNLCTAVQQSDRFDVIHSHAYLWGLPLASLSRAPMVHTMHVTPYDDAAKLRQLYPDELVTAISAFQWSAFPQLPPAPVIHHGIDERGFTVRPGRGDYLCFLGRFTPGKGPLEAIETARAVGLPLRLAGPENEYFRDRIAPLVDGSHVDYVGYVTPHQRAELLAGASALLYPVKSPEPFGLVLVEAMMSGTPVAAYDLGAVRELIAPGVGGVLTTPDGDLAAATCEALRLDRCVVADHARSRFSAARMAAAYAELYEQVAR